MATFLHCSICDRNLSFVPPMREHVLAPSVAMQVHVATKERSVNQLREILLGIVATHQVLDRLSANLMEIRMQVVLQSSSVSMAISKKTSSVRHATDPDWAMSVNQGEVLLGIVAQHLMVDL